MPLTREKLIEILRMSPQAFGVYTTGKGPTEAIVVVIDENHRCAGETIPTDFLGLPLSVRFAQSFVGQPNQELEQDSDDEDD